MSQNGPGPALERLRTRLSTDPREAARKLADIASDPDALRKSVDDANTLGSAVWLTYLFVNFYLSIAVFDVKHEDLLLENAVRLPFLSIELPLFLFFCLGPLILIVVHVYALIYAYILASRLSVYIDELTARAIDDLAMNRLREQLPSSILVQFLAGPNHIRHGIVGKILTSIFWLTLVIAPVLVLLSFQCIFLPYHSATVTWLHRFCIIGDVLLIWILWPAVLAPKRRFGEHGLRRYGAAAILSLVTFGTSIACATFPGEWIDAAVGRLNTIPPNRIAARLGQPGWTSFHTLLFDGPIDRGTLRGTSLFSNTIVLPHFDASAGRRGPAGREGAAAPHPSLQGRHLEGAVLTAANLRGIDLSHADLTAAHLDFAELQDAEMRFTILRGASLTYARMQGAKPIAAQLQAADLTHAYLQGAFLFKAELQAAILDRADLQTSDLSESHLAGGSLKGADLRLANLDRAQAYGATLSGADLRGASVKAAELQGASLDGTDLRGASFTRAFLWRTNLDRLRAVAIDGRDIDWSTFHATTSRLRETQPDTFKAPDSEALRLLVFRDAAGLLTRGKDQLASSLKVLDPSQPFKLDGHVADWQRTIRDGSVDPQSRQALLSETMQALACSPDESASTDVMSLSFARSLKEIGVRAGVLVQSILQDDCPVSTALTPLQKARLSGLARADSTPPPSPNVHDAPPPDKP